MQLQARELENTTHPLLADDQLSLSTHSDPYTDPPHHWVGTGDTPSESSSYCSADEPTQDQVPQDLHYMWPELRAALRKATWRGGRKRTAEAVEAEVRRRMWMGELPPLPRVVVDTAEVSPHELMAELQERRLERERAEMIPLSEAIMSPDMDGVLAQEEERQAAVHQYVAALKEQGRRLREDVWRAHTAMKEVQRKEDEEIDDACAERVGYVSDSAEIDELYARNDERHGTEEYIGPTALGIPKAREGTLMSFLYEHINLCELYRGGQECFLPGREEVADALEVAFGRRRRELEEEARAAHERREGRPDWLAAKWDWASPSFEEAQRMLGDGLEAKEEGSENKTETAKEGGENTTETDEWFEMEDDAYVHASAIGKPTAEDEFVAARTNGWQQGVREGVKEVEGKRKVTYLEGIVGFLTAQLPSTLGFHSLLSRQMEEDEEGKDKGNVRWIADSDPPDMSAVLGVQDLRHKSVRRVCLAAESGEAASKLLLGAMPMLREEWRDNNTFVTMPARVYSWVDSTLTDAADLQKRWMEPRVLMACQELRVQPTQAVLAADIAAGVDVCTDDDETPAHQCSTPATCRTVPMLREQVQRAKDMCKAGPGIHVRRLAPTDTEQVLRALRRGVDDSDPDKGAGGGGWGVDRAEVERLMEERSSRALERDGELLCWAVEDEGGGVGLVYTEPRHRGIGLARWVLAELVASMQLQWAEQGRTGPPFAVVAAADRAGQLLLSGVGFRPSAELCTLQLGPEMDPPPFPDSPSVQSVSPFTQPQHLPRGPHRLLFDVVIDNPLLMSPSQRFDYALRGRSTGALMATQAATLLSHSTEMREHVTQALSERLHLNASQVQELTAAAIASASPPHTAGDPYQSLFKAWRTMLWTGGDGKAVHAAYDAERSFDYLRPEWIEAWTQYGQLFPDDLSPTIGMPRQDEADVGYQF